MKTIQSIGRERLLLYSGLSLTMIIGWQAVMWKWATPDFSLEQYGFTRHEIRAPLGIGNPPRPQSFKPQTLLEPFPPITTVPVVSAEEANKKYQDTELVLGVVVDGKPRAYAINMLTQPTREIMNDTLGRRAIAATW